MLREGRDTGTRCLALRHQPRRIINRTGRDPDSSAPIRNSMEDWRAGRDRLAEASVAICAADKCLPMTTPPNAEPAGAEPALAHDYPFDPAYGYDLAGLLAVEPPPEPPGFADTWRARYAIAAALDPAPEVGRSNESHPGFECRDISYRSTDGFTIRGWLLIPRARAPARVLVCGHGYGGMTGPDFPLPCADAGYFMPCFRGLCRSARAPISTDPWWHVLHDIDKPERYILRGCVEDLWTGVSAVLALFPWLAGRVGYMGISFGGGIGALALPWEPRIARGHLNVPTFGHQPLRLALPTTGSGESVRVFAREHGNTAAALSGYDAAIAARHIGQPMHLACALFDPVVPPPGQFAIYNALPGDSKRLFVQRAGHFDYSERERDEAWLLGELADFFEPLAVSAAS
jgi:cephalosporin-C deacetylase